MADSDDFSDDEADGGLTGFLFGNIDNAGKLEQDSDLFDEESRLHLASLQKFGIGSLLREVVDSKPREDEPDKRLSEDEEDDFMYDDPDDEDPRDSDKHRKQKNVLSKKAAHKGADARDGPVQKLTSAVDYSDMDEIAEEDAESDAVLMPPPPPRTKPSPLAPLSSAGMDGHDDSHNKLNTPLAAMLPSKYADRNVTELFPEFRPNKVLRFSRLFGPGKPSSLPQIWRGVKRKKKRKTRVRHDSATNGTAADAEVHPWKFDFGSPPTSDQIYDNEDEFLRPMEFQDGNGYLGRKKDSNSPGVAPWRYGPAQLWFDMLDVPETGEGFNYGFKTKRKEKKYKQSWQSSILGRKRRRLGRMSSSVGLSIGEGESSDSDDEAVNNRDTSSESNVFPEDAFFMMNQINWEDDVIWNGDEVKNKKLQMKSNAAGWVPSSMMRTAQSLTLSQPVKASSGVPVPSSAGQKHGKDKNNLVQQDDGDDTWYSIFPVENEELIYRRWEDEVIWDAECMPKVPDPKVVTLDPNDENIILGIPDDVDPSTGESTEQVRTKTKIPHPHVRKSKMLLGRAGVIHQIEEDSPPPPPKSPDKDPYNMANDIFYQMKAEPNLKSTVGGTLIQHSIPVIELRAPFVPTHLGPIRLRAFHRPAIKRYSYGPLSTSSEHPVQCLASEIQRKAREREQERLASGGGEVFFMRTPDDLTAKDGELIFCEYSEEHPPLIMQVGMCTKMKNYYKRRAVKDLRPPDYKYGETAYVHTSPFLGSMHPGQSLQSLENNLYRAPIYEHPSAKTDFLIIRTRQGYYLRDVETLYCVGQQCPLYEVPGPNSKRANNFVRDFLQVFIFRLFWSSPDNPRRIKMDDIKRAFPSHSESSIRKRLKSCADFKRTGTDSNWWVQRPDFRLPTEEELRALVSPEQCCSYFSMIAAEQRLRDAGYGEKFLLIAQDDDDEDMQMKMEDEVKVAPWNTTRAYIQAAKNKCLLQLTGPADPTGCGEGFSYIRVPNKPQQNKEEVVQEKKTVTGTDADLRRLSLRDAKALLRKFKVPEEDIKKLSRWEVIDVVRTLSTEKAKAGEEGMTKFSRGNRFSIAEHQERYKEECQRIFELQNKVLGSSELLSSDEASSSDEDNSDMEDMSKNLEKMLTNKKTSSQLTREREEQERKELRKMLMEDSKKKQTPVGATEDSQQGDASAAPGRKLRITRTFRKSNGELFSRVETVRTPSVIDAYVKIRQTKDEAFIRQFAMPDDQQKEEMKREKRRIQEQLRRIKKNQERSGRLSDGAESESRDGLKLESFASSETTSSPQPPSAKKSVKKSKEDKEPKEIPQKASKAKSDLKLKCGACGQVGHMRTNKACPQYSGAGAIPSVAVAMTEAQEEELEKEAFNEDEHLVNVDGTKVTFSSSVLKQADELKRKSLLLKFPKKSVDSANQPASPTEASPPPAGPPPLLHVASSSIASPSGPAKKKRRLNSSQNLDYLKRIKKPAQRRRIDPLVALSTAFEDILKEMSGIKESAQFLYPVQAKLVPDYHRIISHPMDLQKIKENNRTRQYQSREEFLQDVTLLVHNSQLYNGPNHPLTHDAKELLKLCIQRIAEQEQKLMDLETSINPLLDANSKVALSFILDSILQNKIKIMPESYPFHKPVNKKNVKDYFSVIDEPMDLETIEKKIKDHKYLKGKAFLRDIELIYLNSAKYNGPESLFTQQAKKLVEAAKVYLHKYQEPLTDLELKIKSSMLKAGEASLMVEVDGSTGSEYEPSDDENARGPASFFEVKSEMLSGEDSRAMTDQDGGEFAGHHGDDVEVEDSYDPEAQLLLDFGRQNAVMPGNAHGGFDENQEAMYTQDSGLGASQHDSQENAQSDVWPQIQF